MKKRLFVILFAISLVFPLYGGIIGAHISLNGVTQQAEKIEPNIATIGDGTYQSYLNDRWDNNFPGRTVLLKIRNQILYSALNVSPNSNVIIGKEKYLYEPAYILYENQAYPPSSGEYFDNLGNNLHKLKDLLEKNGKDLYVFITPSKVRYCKEYVPNKFNFLDNTEAYTYTNYSMLLEKLEEKEIPYYNSIPHIDKTIADGIFETPLFYPTGIHWSQTYGEAWAAGLLDYINQHSKYDLGAVSVSETLCEEPVYPAADLYSSLNVIVPPKGPWYSTEMVIERVGKDHPNVFLRGGSFMGQSLSALIRSGVFGQDVHFENNYYFTDQYSQSTTLSSFHAYDELDLNRLLGQSDILILEINEGNIHDMSWGFIEYLLDHPDYLDYDTETGVE